MTNDLLGLYERWIADLWNGGTEIVGELLADDFIGHWPDKTVQGPAAVAAIIQEMHAMFDSLVFTIVVGPIAEGELVAARWLGEGTANGKTARFAGNDILRVHEGTFVEYWVGTVQLDQ